MLAYSKDVAANTSIVAVVQSIRVLFLNLGVPAILAMFFAAPNFAAAPLPTLNLKETLTLAMLSLGIGSVFQHMRWHPALNIKIRLVLDLPVYPGGGSGQSICCSFSGS